MTVKILVGDVRERLADLANDSVDCVVTSPPYWGLRDYGVDGQLGMEPTLGEHIDSLVDIFDAIRKVMKPEGTVWLNYGDCYATKPNGRSAAAIKDLGCDDRTFRDKPISTVGPIYGAKSGRPYEPANGTSRRGGGNAPAGAVYGHLDQSYERTRRGGKTQNLGNLGAQTGPRGVGVGMLKPKDLCMIPNRLAIALQDAGWWVRSEIIWGKPNPMPDSSGRYRPSTAHEKIWLLTKSASSYYDAAAVRMPAVEESGPSVSGWAEGRTSHVPAMHSRPKKVRGTTQRHAKYDSNHKNLGRVARGEGRFLRNYEPDLSAIVPPEVWEIATAGFGEAHFATFPPALVVPCILAGCPVGGTVLDPFFGAGTTGLVADRLQRNCVGIELNPEYAQLAMRRIQGDATMFADVSIEHAGHQTRAVA